MLQFLKGFIAHTVIDLNIETEKSEQTYFPQISLSQYYDTTCATKHFKDHNKKLDYAELLSLNPLCLGTYAFPIR